MSWWRSRAFWRGFRDGWDMRRWGRWQLALVTFMWGLHVGLLIMHYFG